MPKIKKRKRPVLSGVVSKKSYSRKRKIRRKSSSLKGRSVSKKLSRKVVSGIKSYSYVVVGFVFLISFVIFFTSFRYYKNPLADAGLGSLSTKTFNSNNDFNLLSIMLENKDLKNSKIIEINLIMFRPSQKKVYILEVDPSDQIFIKGVGYDNVSNLYALSNLKGDNLDVLISALEDYIAQPIDSFVFTDTKGLEQLKNKFGKEFEFSNLKSYPSKFALVGNVKLLKNSVSTDLSAVEVYNILKFVSKLGDTSIVNSKFEEDTNGNEDIFKSEVLSTEKQLIVVLNATSTPGLASDYARILKTQGGEILSIGNAEQKLDKSIIYYHEMTDSVKLLSQNLHIDDVRGITPQNIIDEPIMERSDIVIMLGKDKVID